MADEWSLLTIPNLKNWPMSEVSLMHIGRMKLLNWYVLAKAGFENAEFGLLNISS